jgi:hypothetical protein
VSNHLAKKFGLVEMGQKKGERLGSTLCLWVNVNGDGSHQSSGVLESPVQSLDGPCLEQPWDMALKHKCCCLCDLDAAIWSR